MFASVSLVSLVRGKSERIEKKFKRESSGLKLLSSETSINLGGLKFEKEKLGPVLCSRVFLNFREINYSL